MWRTPPKDGRQSGFLDYSILRLRNIVHPHTDLSRTLKLQHRNGISLWKTHGARTSIESLLTLGGPNTKLVLVVLKNKIKFKVY